MLCQCTCHVSRLRLAVSRSVSKLSRNCLETVPGAATGGPEGVCMMEQDQLFGHDFGDSWIVSGGRWGDGTIVTYTKFLIKCRPKIDLPHLREQGNEV